MSIPKLNEIMVSDIVDVILDLDEFGVEATLFSPNSPPVTITVVPYPDDESLLLNERSIDRIETFNCFMSSSDVSTSTTDLRRYRFEIYGVIWKWDVDAGVLDDSHGGAVVSLKREKVEKQISTGLFPG